MPMRAIPFRVICLLGMNDGDYPRRQTPADFDLMALPTLSRPGDRSRREDDRYLFLEALLSARDTLHISWVGLSERDNSVMPPSVLVGQLRDYLAAGWHASNDMPLLSALTTVHPLQAFSRRYFDTNDPAMLTTYASEWEHARRDIVVTKTFDTLPDVLPTAALSIAQLQNFLARPVRYFFNQRLKVYFDDSDTEVVDDEPFALGGLDRYQAEQELLTAALGTAAPREAIMAATERLRAQGALPPGGFGSLAQAELDESVGDLAALWQFMDELYPHRQAPVELQLSVGGWTIEDWLNDLRTGDDDQRLRITLIQGGLRDGKALRYDKLIAPWIIHLLANAQGLRMRTHIVAADAHLRLEIIDTTQALAWLTQLIAALEQGLTQPLAASARTAFAWLQAERGEKPTYEAARLCYEGSDFGMAAELQRDPYLSRAWPSFAALHHGGFEATLPLYRPLMETLIDEAAA
jgi:exodeoxyribonuclease V gamma subunit